MGMCALYSRLYRDKVRWKRAHSKQRAAYPFPDERALLMDVKKTKRTSSGAGNQFWSREPIIETENQLLEQEPVLGTAS
jgi:hypothetical protein